MDIKDRLRFLLFGIDIEYIELFSGLTAVAWGITLLIIPDLFETNAYIYSAFLTILPSQFLWAILAGVGGALQTYMVYKNQHRNILFRRLLTLGSVFFWTYVTTAFFMSARSISTATAVYGITSLMVCWAYIRLTIRHGG